MLKKQKYKVKRRNTAPPTNLPTSAPVRAGSTSIPPVPQSAPYRSSTSSGGGGGGAGSSSGAAAHSSTSPPLVDLCDSPTHATAVWIVLTLPLTQQLWLSTSFNSYINSSYSPTHAAAMALQSMQQLYKQLCLSNRSSSSLNTCDSPSHTIAVALPLTQQLWLSHPAV